MISVAIPYHGDRSKWTLQTVVNASAISKVKEIIITIDPSNTDPKKLIQSLRSYRKVKVYRNDKRLFVFRNKVNAVSKCTQEWVALIDSDNIAGGGYFGAFSKQPKNKSILYQPSIGHTMIHYEEYIGEDINLKWAAKNIDEVKVNMMLNTMNYMFHRETWLNALKGAIKDEYDPLTADSAFINYTCLKAGMIMRIIPGMEYVHTVHPVVEDPEVQSTYRIYAQDAEREYAKIIKQLKESLNENSNGTGSVSDKRQNTIPETSNWAGSGRQGRGVLQEPEGCENKADILSD
ncbi:MAG: glycosyltransferase [Candidatus Atribacteria bacterium]|nr:glycosyltransferase [Candidatus Atribacteria bacterium]